MVALTEKGSVLLREKKWERLTVLPKAILNKLVLQWEKKWERLMVLSRVRMLEEQKGAQMDFEMAR